MGGFVGMRQYGLSQPTGVLDARLVSSAKGKDDPSRQSQPERHALARKKLHQKRVNQEPILSRGGLGPAIAAHNQFLGQRKKNLAV
jgi:hypothetical protein